MNKDARQLLRLAAERGLTIKSGRKHVKIFGRDGLVTVIPNGSRQNQRNQTQAELAVRKAKP